MLFCCRRGRAWSLARPQRAAPLRALLAGFLLFSSGARKGTYVVLAALESGNIVVILLNLFYHKSCNYKVIIIAYFKDLLYRTNSLFTNASSISEGLNEYSTDSEVDPLRDVCTWIPISEAK